MTDTRIRQAIERARADNYGPRGHSLNEVEAMLDVIEAAAELPTTERMLSGDWDASSTVSQVLEINNALAAFADVVLGREGT